VIVNFRGDIWLWRGPSPFYFVSVPRRESEAIQEIQNLVTYGWGMIPATVRIGETQWKTALWPKDGVYIVPLKDRVRKAESLSLSDTVEVELVIEPG